MPEVLILAQGRDPPTVGDHRLAGGFGLRLKVARRLWGNARRLTGHGLDRHTGFRRWSATKLAHEALNALIAAGEAGHINQVLPDGRGVAAMGEPHVDGLSMKLTGAGRGTTTGLRRRRRQRSSTRRLRAEAGGHLIGWFCGFAVSPKEFM